MRLKGVSIYIAFLLLALTSALVVSAGTTGSLEPPGPPEATFSYTFQHIYDRLDTGEAGSPITFTEPVSGPGTATMRSLDEIMDKAPVADNTNGATSSEVLTGTTYWGLRTVGTWGPQAGTMPDNGAVTISPATAAITIALGFHSGSGYVEGDADLVAGNIRSGASVFGVDGTCHRLPATGLTASHAPNDDGALQFGCLPAIEACFGADGCNFNRTHLPWHSSAGTGFADNGDGTVTDLLTGLIWLKNASCFGTMVWSQAVAEANTLNSGQCGLTDGSVEGDWRLPNSNELRSLIAPDQDNPSLPVGYPFTASKWQIYWSSTTQTNNPNQAWDVDMGNGYSGHYPKESYSRSVWPVRGGQ